MTTLFNFSKWTIGNSMQWAIKWSWKSPPTGRHRSRKLPSDLRRWIRLEDGPYLHAGLEGGHVQIQFLRPGDRERVRYELRHAPRPIAAWIDLQGSDEVEGNGRIGIIRTAIPVSLDAPLEIIMPQNVIEKAKEFFGTQLTPEQLMSRLSEDATLPSPDKPLLIFQSDSLLDLSQTASASRITLYLSRGAAVECNVSGGAGKQFLLADNFRPYDIERPLKGGRILAAPSPPMFHTASEVVDGCDLSILAPRVQRLIRAWLEYEEVGRDYEELMYRTRAEHPLEYIAMEQISSSDSVEFYADLVNGSDAFTFWSNKSKMRDIGAAVEIHGLVAESPLYATLKSFSLSDTSHRTRARLVVKGATTSLDGKGSIIAVENRGDKAQRQRRQRAFERLRSGEVICANLLEYLSNPLSVPPPTGRARPDSPQDTAVAACVSLPDLFLIQGPPGTGKTSVIVRIVEQLRRRYKRGILDPTIEDEDVRPLRVLITSIQNEAVANVMEKLQEGYVFVHAEGLQAEMDPIEIYIQQGAFVAQTLQSQLEISKTFRSFQLVQTLQARLLELRSKLFDAEFYPVGELLRNLAEGPEGQILTSELGRDLEDLMRKVDDHPCGRTQAIAFPVEGRVAAAFQSALSHLRLLSPDLSQQLYIQELDRIQNLGKVIEDLTRSSELLPDVLLRAAMKWKAFASRFGLSVEAGELDDGARKAWANLISETLLISPVSETLVPPADSTQRAVWHSLIGWLNRAWCATEAMLVDFESCKEPVLADWLDVLANRPAELRAVFRKHAATRLATCQKSDMRGDEDEPYDVVIVDEAARAGLDILVPLTLARHIILVGDHKQLPPHVEKEYLWKLPEKHSGDIDIERYSLFKWLMENLPESNRVSLKRQFRMHEDIGRMVSAVFYEPELTLEHEFSGSRAHERRPHFEIADNRPLVWIDTSDVLNTGNVEVKDHGWPCFEENEFEAELITIMLAKADRVEMRRLADEQKSAPIGIISFYARQCELVSKKLGELGDAELSRLVKIGTVDSFQGHEFPLVVLSTVRSNSEGKIGFLKPPERLNVAMSRAQRQLVIIGDSRTLAGRTLQRGSEHFRHILQIVTDGGGVIPSSSFYRGMA